MFTNLLRKSIHRPIGTSVIFAAVVISGLYAGFHLPLEILPSVQFPKFYIQTSLPGASPRTVEAYVTSLIEAEITTLKGVANIRSESREGLSRIEVEVQRNTDVDYFRYVLQERLSFLQEELPEDALPPKIISYIPEEIQQTKFMSYHLVGNYPDAFLRRIALQQIRPAINSLPGIAGVEVIGGRDRQIQIRFDPQRLKAYQLTIHDIISALRQANRTQSPGFVRKADRKVTIMLQQEIRSLYDLENLPLQTYNAAILRLKDVATVLDTLSPAFSIQRINGKSTIFIQIEKEPRANTITVANSVKQLISALPEKLPPGMEFIIQDDQSAEIKENLHQLFFRALFGFGVIFIVLTLFLRRLRYAFIIQGSIVISVLFTLLLMFLFRTSLNLITLAGLALGFGLLVDNAIVVLENIYRLRSTGISRAESCLTGVKEVALPLMASTLTTLAALLPFLYLMDELRIYYTPFAVTVALALIASLATAFFLIPTVAYHWQKKSTADQQPKSVSPEHMGSHENRFTRLYQKTLRSALAHPWLTLAVTIWLFGIPFWKLPTEVIPEEDDGFPIRIAKQAYNAVWQIPYLQEARPYLDHFFGGSLYLFYRYVNRGELWRWGDATTVQVYISLPSGTEISETDHIARLMEKTAFTEEDIAEVRTRIYPDFAHIEVQFTPETEFSVIPYMIKEKLVTRATRTGNAAISVVGYGPGFSSGGSGVTMQNRLLLSGYNYAELETFAEKLKQKLERHPRVKDVRTDLTRSFFRKDAYETSLELNRYRLAESAVTTSDVIQSVNPFLSRYLYRQRLRIGWEEIPYSIVSNRYDRFQLYQLLQLPLRNNQFREIRMKHLGAIAFQRVQPLIERENQQYYKVISFDYLAPPRFAQKFVENFLKTTAVPTGFTLKQERFWWWEEKEKNITTVLLIAILLMYMVLAGLYESFSYPFLIFLIIPLSLIGVFLAYYLTDTTFNQTAYIGVIFLMGIVVNNSIILLDRMNQLKQIGGFQSLPDLLVTAGTQRLRPILMTSITTIAGLLPLLLLSGAKSEQDMWATLSLSTIGGLVSATLLGLIVLPTLVLIVERLFGRFRRVSVTD